MHEQEPVLFQGTIFQNVANGFLDHQKLLPREEQLRLIQEACETSNAHEFISQLPEVPSPLIITEVDTNAI
jgi:ATP-binding cassette subfamily B (MDR/TAP) protein 1